MEGSPSCALSIESSNVREKIRTPFAGTGVGTRTNNNRRCEVLFGYDLRSSDPQSPAGMEDGLGPGIRDRDSR